MWNKIIKRDQYGAGLLLGLLLPALLYLVLFAIDFLVFRFFSTHILAKQDYLYILSLVVNLFTIRYYFVNLKYDKTGRGILIVTFAYALVYFILY